MNDTPETDAAEMPIDRVDTIASRPCCVVTADFARKLERERDKARNLVQSGIRARASLNEALDKTLHDLREQREQNAKLCDIAERAIGRVENECWGIKAIPDFWAELRAELDKIKEGAK